MRKVSVILIIFFFSSFFTSCSRQITPEERIKKMADLVKEKKIDRAQKELRPIWGFALWEGKYI